MVNVLEFHGRLARSDGSAAGDVEMLFALYAAPARASGRGVTDAVLWQETHRGVHVDAAGHYTVVLGIDVPLGPDLFNSVPRYLSARLISNGKPTPETAARVPLLGNDVVIASRIQAIEDRFNELDGDDDDDDVPTRHDRSTAIVNRLRDTVEDLKNRLHDIKSTDGSSMLTQRLDILERRLGRLDGDDGRLDRIEDELEDLVGPDGDVVDLVERMDTIEGQAPELIANLRRREGPEGAKRIEDMETALATLRRRFAEIDVALNGLVTALEEVRDRPIADIDALGGLKRTGDVMTGGLTINRGGLEVLSGGVSCRSADVSSLEATNLVKSPKMIADAFELRGDLTVDNTRRALQVRIIEGRQGSARRDGALHLNTRGGAEVVVGNAESAKGMQVFGTVSAAATTAEGSALAQLFEAGSDVKPGDVVRIGDTGRVARCRGAYDKRVVGVVTEAPGLLLGGTPASGKVAVALAGVVACRVEADSGAIEAGDLLAPSSKAGHAMLASDAGHREGAIVGKALEGLASGAGTIRVLLQPG